MGNACFGERRSGKGVVVVHPLDHPLRDEGVRRLKVRMTSRQLKELMAELKMDATTKDLSDSELGRLVFRECLKGRLHARLVDHTGDGSDPSTFRSAKGWGLSPIQEHSDDDDDHS